MQIYSDRRGQLEKLLEDKNYEAIVLVINDERHITAGLFQKVG